MGRRQPGQGQRLAPGRPGLRLLVASGARVRGHPTRAPLDHLTSRDILETITACRTCSWTGNGPPARAGRSTCSTRSTRASSRRSTRPVPTTSRPRSPPPAPRSTTLAAGGPPPVAERAGVLRRIADLLQRDKEHIARVETLDTGKTLVESRIDVDDVTAVFRYYADLAATQEGRTVDVGHAARALPHRARAGRGVRADHAVELPPAAAVVEARARARRRVHLRDQAQRGHAVDVGAARAPRRGGGRPAGRGQHPARHRAVGRCAAGRARGTSTWSASPAASPPGRRSSGRRRRP